MNNKALAEIERYEQIAEDIKKVICFNKHAGQWYWHDKNDNVLHEGFATRYEALLDVVEPYVGEDSDE